MTAPSTRPDGNSLAWIDDEAATLFREGLVRRLTVQGPSTPGRLETSRRWLRNFASNDYLGLASDPRIVAAATEAAARYGWGSGASALVCGWREPHERLARELAEFEQTEAAVLFPSGYAANLGAITALVGAGDAVYSDRLNHSCLIQGVRMAGASLRVFPHNDPNRLDSMLTRDHGRFRRSLIATEGVFSMDGDLAPLADLADLAQRFGAMLLVDEAHGTGVFGPGGRGASEVYGVADRVDIKVGTLSKALGSIGGFVAGSKRLIDHLVNRAPTLIYSTSLPPAAAAAASEALRIVRDEPGLRQRVFDHGENLRAGLERIGRRSVSSRGPIVPFVVGDPSIAVALSRFLATAGYLVPAIRPPTVPAGTSRLRVSLSAAHDSRMVTSLLGVLADGFLEFASQPTSEDEGAG